MQNLGLVLKILNIFVQKAIALTEGDVFRNSDWLYEDGGLSVVRYYLAWAFFSAPALNEGRAVQPDFTNIPFKSLIIEINCPLSSANTYQFFRVT